MRISRQIVDEVIRLSADINALNTHLNQKYRGKNPVFDLSDVGKYDSTPEGIALKQAKIARSRYMLSLPYETIMGLVALMYIGRGDGIAEGATDLYVELDECVDYAKSHFPDDELSVATKYLEEKYPLPEYLSKAKSLVPNALV